MIGIDETIESFLPVKTGILDAHIQAVDELIVIVKALSAEVEALRLRNDELENQEKGYLNAIEMYRMQGKRREKENLELKDTIYYTEKVVRI